MNTRPRLIRALSALLLVTFLVPGFVIAAAGPAAAAQPVVIGADTTVLDSSPMWTVDIVFTLNGPVDCSAGAELAYRVRPVSVEGVLGSGTTGTIDACLNEPGVPANKVVLHFDLLGRGTDAFPPSSYALDPVLGTLVLIPSRIAVSGRIIAPQSGVAAPNAPINGPLYSMLPTAPVWIGMGDGYSSQLTQNADGCITASCYVPNDNSGTWMAKAVEDINVARVQQTNSNTEWQLDGVVVAQDGATSLDMKTGTQNTQMRAELEKRVIDRPGNQYGDLSSWNWVSISAGLVDSGIPQVMKSYSAAANGSPGGLFPYNVATNPKPWEVASATQCPDLDGVLATLNGPTGAAIKPNLRDAVASARGIDLHIHVVQVIYPWLTEPGNACATDNATSVSNRTVMQRLREVSDITTDSASDTVVALDLQDPVKGFGDTPTGDLPSRANTRLWLARPFGYPYPSPTGSTVMRNAATILVGSAAADVLPPEVIGTPRTQPVGEGGQWWNTPTVDIDWTASDPSGLATVPGPWPHATVATTEGNVTYTSAHQACDLIGRCAWGTLPLSIDYSAPRAFVSLDSTPNDAGWFNTPPVITWGADDTKVDADGNPVLDENGNSIAVSGVDETGIPAEVLVETSGANQTFPGTAGEICDYALNCVPVPQVTVNVDLIAPTLTPVRTSTDTTATNGWYQAPVTVTWTKADQGGSGFASATPPAGGTVTRGTETLEAAVCDIADNCTPATVTVKVDGEAPVINFAGGAVPGDEYPSNAVPTVSCTVDDQPDLSGGGACQLTVTKSPVVGGKSTWTYTANGSDLAGNPAPTSTLSFVVTSTGEPEAENRMTGEAEFESSRYGDVEMDLSIRCSGEASAMNVEWGNKGFELDDVTAVDCRDNPSVNGPGPFDTLTMTGTGTYCTGGTFGESSYHDDHDRRGGWWNKKKGSGYHGSGFSAATSRGETSRHGGCTPYPGQQVTCVTGTITVTMVDASGSGSLDTVNIVIKDNKGKVVLSISGRIEDGNLITNNASGPPPDVTPPTVTPKITAPTSAPTGGSSATITVSIACTTVTVTSSKDISHTVVILSDGTYLKYENLSGYTWTKTFSKSVASVTAKAGTSVVTGTSTGCSNPTTTTNGGTSGGSATPTNGWYRTPVTVSWTTADNVGGIGLVTSTPPASTTVSVNGETTITTPPVCDKAGNCSVGTVTVKIDRTPPTVSIDGAADGATYAERPTVTCVAVDQVLLSGVDTCTLTSTSKSVSGGTSYTYTATATDKAGNVATKTITFTVRTANKMVGAGTVNGPTNAGTVHTDLNIRCGTGQPDELAVNWSQGSFDLKSITSKSCTATTLTLTGSGSLCAGTFAGHRSYADDDTRSYERDGGSWWRRSSYSSSTYGGSSGGSGWHKDRDGNQCRDRFSGASKTCSTATIELRYVDNSADGKFDTLEVVIVDTVKHKDVLVVDTTRLSAGNFVML